MASSSRLPLLRRISILLKAPPSTTLRSSRPSLAPRFLLRKASAPNVSPWTFASSRSFCSGPLNLPRDSQGPAAIDYRSVLSEDEYHRLANSTIQYLQEKLEEYCDIVELEGFDVDYGNEVLTLKPGTLGTYVMNKQTPNRQIWLSSPISGPSRFDWDHNAQAWVYRRTKANLLKLLESELEQLCGKPVNLS
ncbi:frataxin homolog [Hibiscus trionum]|uniref:ferroxidase n=1 Tax=Hibiscus trionum TaxID=183268 RepID=A0A9W7JEE8_HIBTR|nr:frataxin homolog [Hibiscus trionum]